MEKIPKSKKKHLLDYTLIIVSSLLLALVLMIFISFVNYSPTFEGDYLIKITKRYPINSTDEVYENINPDKLPSNYDDTIQKLGLSLDQKQKSHLLRYGYLVLEHQKILNEILEKYSNKDLTLNISPNVITSLESNRIKDVNQDIKKTYLPLLLDKYLDRIIYESSQSNIFSLLNPDYDSNLKIIDSFLVSIREDLNTSGNIDEVLNKFNKHENISDKDWYRLLAIINYLTKKTNSISEYSNVHTLLNYLYPSSNNFDLTLIDKYLKDKKITNIGDIVKNDYSDFKTIQSSLSAVEQNTLNTLVVNKSNIEKCKEVKYSQFKMVNPTQVNEVINETKNIFQENMKTLGINYQNKDYLNLLSIDDSNIEKMFNENCRVLNFNSNMVLRIQNESDKNILNIYIETGQTENQEIKDENFDERYDVEPTKQISGTVRIPILMYHQITNVPAGTKGSAVGMYVTPDMFEQQLAYLVKMNYKTVTPEEFYNSLKEGKNPSQKSIMLTFDDGVLNHYTNAYPLLKKYGLKGVFYIVTGRTSIKPNQLKEMSDNGMVIDSHSRSHMDLQKEKNYSTLYGEIYNSKLNLENITGKKVNSIAYPYCVANSTSIGITSTSGYLLGTSCGKTVDHRLQNRLSLSRIHVDNEMGTFKQMISGIR